MSKRKRPRKPAPPRKPVVRKVVLPPVGVVRVEVPKGVLPIVAVDPVRNIVEIVPLKQAPKKKESWWSAMFGPG